MTIRRTEKQSFGEGKNPEIGIIGGTGGIGKWFVDFFRKQGYTTHAAGRSTGMEWATLVRQCAVVIISVPIGATCDTIRKVGGKMGKEQVLMDLTSLKAKPVKAMLQSSKAEVVGLHPLFGPDAPSLEGQNIVVCPSRGKKWLSWIKDILIKNGARLQELTPEKHDKMMAYIQGLPHLTTILLGAVIRRDGIDPVELGKCSTPIFRARMAMADKVFRRNPRLYAEVLVLNPETKKILSRCEKELKDLKVRIQKADVESLMNWLAGESATGGGGHGA
jgi:prephenate dehydrogenase